MKLYKRIPIFILAIFFSGLGIAMTTQADLGTTPISSLPYVLTFISPASFGITTIVVNVLFLLIQIIVLKKDFRKIDYLQLLVTLIFGFFIDLGMLITSFLKTDIYILQLLMLVTGSAILALGVELEVYADLLYVPGEGVVKAFSHKYNKDFGKIKVRFDTILCVLSIILSFAFLGKIQGLREGTIFSAFLVGSFISLYNMVWLKCSSKPNKKMS